MKSIWDEFPTLLFDLGKCLALKLSARKTAQKLSEITGQTITRNAVIGKAKREGLELNAVIGGRPKGYQPPRKHTAQWKPKSRIPMPNLSTETAQPYEFLGLNIHELKDNSCRYIEGEVPGVHSYCGQPTFHGSWCEHHFKIVTGVNHVHAGEAGSLQNGRGRPYRSHPGF